MYSYSQLLLRNFLFALGFSACVALASIVLLALQTSGQQNQHQQTLLSLEQKTQFINHEELVKHLAHFNRYHFLNIINKEGAVIVNQQQSPMLLDELVLAPINEVILPNSSLTIRYQLDVRDSLTLLRNTILAVFVLSIIFIVIAASFSIGR